MNDQVKVFKALGNPTRLKMVRDLAACPSKSCADISEKLSYAQPTISHHFQRLVEAGIIAETKVKTQKIYSLNQKLLQKSGVDLSKLLRSAR